MHRYPPSIPFTVTQSDRKSAVRGQTKFATSDPVLQKRHSKSGAKIHRGGSYSISEAERRTSQDLQGLANGDDRFRNG